MNAQELINNKRERIYRHWLKMSYVTDTYEEHPDRDWLDEHCVIKNIASELPEDVQIVQEREAGCIELFRDFETAQLNHDTLEYIEIGHVCDFVEWDDENTVKQSNGPYDGFKECLDYAVEYAEENNLAILQYTSITSFDNQQYRSMSNLS